MSRCLALALRWGKFVVELLWACPLVVSVAGVRVVEFRSYEDMQLILLIVRCFVKNIIIRFWFYLWFYLFLGSYKCSSLPCCPAHSWYFLGNFLLHFWANKYVCMYVCMYVTHVYFCHRKCHIIMCKTLRCRHFGPPYIKIRLLQQRLSGIYTPCNL